MNATSKVYQARARVWSNLPGAPATFKECKRACGRGDGRDGGICLECATDDLAEIIGSQDAIAYVMAVRLVRDLEKEQDDIFGDQPS